MSASLSEFHFLNLPLELRDQIYEHHLEEFYRKPTEFIPFKPKNEPYCIWQDNQSPLLGVSKQVSWEFLELQRRRKTFTYQISHQFGDFDGLTKACSQARQEKLNFNEISEITVEIFPPNVYRPGEIFSIWERLEVLCYELRRTQNLRRASIIFVENGHATWSFEGRPRSFFTPSSIPSEQSDIHDILEILELLRGVTQWTVHLPPSLLGDESMQRTCNEFVTSMLPPRTLDTKETERRAEIEAIWGHRVRSSTAYGVFVRR